MARSVSVPRAAIATAYMDISWVATEDDFDFHIDNIRTELRSKWKSLTECNKWIGNECDAILENELVYVCVSTYESIQALFILPKADKLGFGVAWARKIGQKFVEMFGELRRVGTFSNGESVFEYIQDSELTNS